MAAVNSIARPNGRTREKSEGLEKKRVVAAGWLSASAALVEENSSEKNLLDGISGRGRA